MRAYAVIAGLVVLNDVVNVLSVLHDAVRRGEHLAAWEPTTWEGTSGLAGLIACPLIYAALLLAPLNRHSWPRNLVVHFLASVAFSALHVTLMTIGRIVIYSAVGFHYHVEAGAAVYEYRKDLLAYLVEVTIFQAFTARRLPSARSPLEAPEPVATPATFDILEGTRTIRVSSDEIAAIKSGGNYAEFFLTDGRRPLMRITLGALATRLEPHGFMRTHRSWLVNPNKVHALKPTGSGDYDLQLEANLNVPLSRRYTALLQRLKRS